MKWLKSFAFMSMFALFCLLDIQTNRSYAKPAVTFRIDSTKPSEVVIFELKMTDLKAPDQATINAIYTEFKKWEDLEDLEMDADKKDLLRQLMELELNKVRTTLTTTCKMRAKSKAKTRKAKDKRVELEIETVSFKEMAGNLNRLRLGMTFKRNAGKMVSTENGPSMQPLEAELTVTVYSDDMAPVTVDEPVDVVIINDGDR